jgi:large-conductance mechanosensitive channel
MRIRREFQAFALRDNVVDMAVAFTGESAAS